MKKTNLLRKALVMICVMALVACLSVAATIAYFTDSEAVTNTFTVGKVVISMDELDTDDSTPNKDRDTANEYHLIPGKTYEKDPTVHVEAKSEDCFIYVKVENGLKNIQKPVDFTEKNANGEDVIDKRNVEAQIENKGWTKLNDVENVWYREHTKNNAQVNYVVFEKFAISDGATNDSIAQYAKAEIKVTAYAIQMAGFEGKPGDAWKAYNDQNN